MSIFYDQNQYPGVNAHVNSYLQNTPGKWTFFHSLHITHLFEEIESSLPPGYYAMSEAGLQITRFDLETGATKFSTTRPDVTVFQTSQSASEMEAESIVVAAPALAFDVLDTFESPEELPGIVIYQIDEPGGEGNPVTRVELLSPANVPGGSGYEHYSRKRRETLSAGLSLVEIDYLHQHPPIVSKLPRYTEHDDIAPYMVLVSDLRPTQPDSKTYVYPVGILDPLPVIRIPLAEDDTMTLNFATAYDRTFGASSFFRRQVANYAADPIAFDRYSAADRARLQTFLNTVREQPPNTPNVIESDQDNA